MKILEVKKDIIINMDPHGWVEAVKATDPQCDKPIKAGTILVFEQESVINKGDNEGEVLYVFTFVESKTKYDKETEYEYTIRKASGAEFLKSDIDKLIENDLVEVLK